MLLYTLTGNLLAEFNYDCQQIPSGNTIRAQKSYFQVGGKGINVSRVAKAWGLKTRSICFPAGLLGERCIQWLKEQHLDTYNCFLNKGETRSGAVFHAPGQKSSTLLGPDLPLTDDAWLQAIDFFKTHLNSGDILAICGSIPGWKHEFQHSIQTLMETHSKTHFILDTYGPPLTSLLPLPFSLIKINRHEFESGILDDSKETSITKKIPQFRKLNKISKLIITDGPNAIHFSSPSKETEIIPVRAVPEVSATGCGDIFLGSLIALHYVKKIPWTKAIKVCLPLLRTAASNKHLFDPDWIKKTDTVIP